MRIKTFRVEQWMNTYENDCKYNLGETCIDPLTIDELLELSGTDPADFFKELGGLKLTYGHIYGSPDLTSGIAKLYNNIDAAHVLPAHGTIGANHQAIISILDASDNMISVMPTYQQHYSIPESVGAEVRILKLRPENGFLPDLNELERLTDGKTKLININNPNNPTGSLMPESMLKDIAAIADQNGAYVLCDEAYRGISEDGGYMPSITDVYDKGISTSSMSKVFSFAGLRLGWIATQNDDILTLCKERRDFDTISCGVIDDFVASLALKHTDAILARNREILFKNRKILDDFVNATPDVHYVRPVAGSTALVYYDKPVPSYDMCVDLLRKKSVLLTPGQCFEMESCVRVGYAYDAKELKTGLHLFGEYLKEI